MEGLHTATEALCVPRPSVCVLHTTSDAQFAISRTTFCTFVHILHILCNVLQNTEPSTMSGNFVFIFAFNSLSASACKGLDGLFVCLFVFVSYMLSIYRTATTLSEKFLHIFVCFVFYFVYNEFPS